MNVILPTEIYWNTVWSISGAARDSKPLFHLPPPTQTQPNTLASIKLATMTRLWKLAEWTETQARRHKNAVSYLGFLFIFVVSGKPFVCLFIHFFGLVLFFLISFYFLVQFSLFSLVCARNCWSIFTMASFPYQIKLPIFFLVLVSLCFLSHSNWCVTGSSISCFQLYLGYFLLLCWESLDPV